MDGAHPKPAQRTTPGRNCCPPAQKLKDSCDLCSASKVRCNKQKPSCGRCDKLGYHCFYSPARRGGRPYRPRTNQPDGAAAESSGRQPQASRSGDESIGSHSESSSSREQHNPPRHEERGESVDKQHQQSDNIFNIDAVLMHLRGSRMSQSAQADCSQSNHDLFKGPSQDASQQTPTPLPDKPNSSQTTSKPSEPLPRISTYGGEKNPALNPPDSDCATVAMDLLQQLDTTSTRLQSGAAAGNQISAQTVGAAMQAVTTAFRRLSTILICPCSERSDIGLLAAAVCVTILDVHGIIITNSTRPKDDPSPTLLEDAAQWDRMDVDRMDVCTKCFQDRPEDEVTTMRVLGELPKVSKVVLQFAKRYSERDGEESSPDFLPALAAFLRSRLQAITNEATDRLV